MTPEQLETGYWDAYRQFYAWPAIFRSAWAQPGLTERLRHLAYVGGWKKCDPLWDWVIRAKRVAGLLPLLETVLIGARPDRLTSSEADSAWGRPVSEAPDHGHQYDSDSDAHLLHHRYGDGYLAGSAGPVGVRDA